MQKRTALLFGLAAVVWVAIPLIAGAQNPLVQCEGALDCDLCELGKVMQRIIDFLVVLAIPIAAAMFAIAGFLYVSASGDPTKITRAHKIFQNVLIGFLIAISAWLVVNTIMTMVFSKGFFDGGSWFELKCVPDSQRPTDATVGDLINEVIPGAGGGGSGNIDPSGGSAPGGAGLTYQTGISNQVGTASGPLNNLISCIGSKTSGQISSISDSRIVSGTYTFEHCAANGQAGGCAHTKDSCHYGGNTCVGSSYAVDLVGDNTSLESAARECGADYVQDEGNHVHASVGAVCGCN